MIDRYEFLNLLGEGGAGTVFKAWDNRLQRAVAIKRLLPAHAREGAGVGTDLNGEASTLAAFQHPNVVSVHDLGFLGDEPCIVMEFLNGETLQQILQNGALTYQDFLSVAFQSLEALEAAHRLGIQHRDIKPSNFMVQWTPNGKFVLKMVDFGISEVAYRPAVKIDEDNVYGSVYFLAPEQFGKGTVDHRADLYSLGCVFYACLTTQNPFTGETTVEIRDAHLNGQVNPTLSQRSDIPAAMKDFISKLMSRKPEARFQTATEAKSAFLAAQKLGAAVHTGPVAMPKASSRTATTREEEKLTITQKIQRLPKAHRLAYGGATMAALVGMAVAFSGNKSAEIPAAVVTANQTQDLEDSIAADPTSALALVHKAPFALPAGIVPTENLPQLTHLKARFMGGVAAFTEGGVTLAKDGDKVELWKDLIEHGGPNHLDYIYSRTNSELRKERLPKFIQAKSHYNLPKDAGVMQFNDAGLTLLGSSNEAPSPWVADSAKLYAADQLTFAIILRNRMHERPSGERGIVLGSAGEDRQPYWDVWVQDSTYCFGDAKRPQDTISVPIPPKTPETETNPPFQILICQMDRTANEAVLFLATETGTEQRSPTCQSFAGISVPKKLRLGAKANNSPSTSKKLTHPFIGDVADLIVYDTVLTDAERRQLIQSLRAQYFTKK